MCSAAASHAWLLAMPRRLLLCPSLFWHLRKHASAAHLRSPAVRHPQASVKPTHMPTWERMRPAFACFHALALTGHGQA